LKPEELTGWQGISADAMPKPISILPTRGPTVSRQNRSNCYSVRRLRLALDQTNNALVDRAARTSMFTVRVDSSQRIIRRPALNGAVLVDAGGDLRYAAKGVGKEQFYDHVHLTPETTSQQHSWRPADPLLPATDGTGVV
jgi:hypothetical protein